MTDAKITPERIKAAQELARQGVVAPLLALTVLDDLPTAYLKQGEQIEVLRAELRQARASPPHQPWLRRDVGRASTLVTVLLLLTAASFFAQALDAYWLARSLYWACGLTVLFLLPILRQLHRALVQEPS